MDDCVGQVLAALRNLGLEQDTVVLYTSDHGEMLGAHGLWNKVVFYEPSVGVPLIFRAPGVTSDSARSRTPFSLVQVLPTILELCGVAVPSGLGGESLVVDLREANRTRATTFYSEFNVKTPRERTMIRRGDYKYSLYLDDTPELYNLREDPSEMHNLVNAEKSKAEELKAAILAWK
jgi:choline-sulfatase